MIKQVVYQWVERTLLDKTIVSFAFIVPKYTFSVPTCKYKIWFDQGEFISDVP